MRSPKTLPDDPKHGSGDGAAGEPAGSRLPEAGLTSVAAPPAFGTDRSGAQIGSFALRRKCGQGAMGVVYAAVDLRDDQPVAVKVLPASLVADTRSAARFVAEAEALASLDHAAIVRHIAHGTTPEGEPFLAMEWLDGEDLAECLARRALTVREGIALGRRVAEALAVAHARGIVHRDIKPSNLFLPGGDVEQARILDFGIARVVHAPRVLTVTGVVVGTPGYMAPEQARGDSVIDGRADLFSLGAVLFECLAGQPAFAGSLAMAILLKVLLEVPPSLGDLRADVPHALADLVARMLAKERAARPESAAAVAAELAAMALDSGGSVPGRAPTRSGAIVSLTGSERRFLCVIVAGAPGAGAAPARERAETMPDELEARHAALSQVNLPHGARIERLLDGSLRILLPATGSAADQAARAARCALVLRPHLLDVPLAIAAGLADASTPVPVGQVVDRAARLVHEAAGAASGVRVDDVIAALLDVRFVVRDGPDGRVLLNERDPGEDARLLLGRASPCVGRERELRMIGDLLDECAVERIARPVLVTAPTGTGKSRLLHELLRAVRRRDDGVSVWLGRGDLLGAGSAFAMVSSALHHAARMQAGEAPEVRRRKLEERVARHVAEGDRARVAAFLGEIVGTPFPEGDLPILRSARANPALMAEQVRRAFVDVLAAECAAGPVLLVIEDLHWGDLPSVKLFDAALGRLQHDPLMVLALARPEVHDRFPKLWAERGTQEIRLQDLPRRAAAGLVRHALDDTISAEAVDRIVERAGGNAFYLEELIRAVAEGRGQVLPATMLAMVQARLDALEPNDRRVLRAASVFGEALWSGGVLALVGDVPRARVVERLAAMVEREVLARREESRFPGEEELAFRHALLREGAYSTLTDGDRALGHRLAGAWLEERGESDPMVLVEHFEQGGEPGRAEIYCLRAARQAYLGKDLVAAAARAEQGLRLGDAGEHRLELLESLAMTLHLLGDLDGAMARVEEILRVAPPGSRVACVALGGKLLMGQQRGAPQAFVEVMDALRDVAPTPENAGPLIRIYWALLVLLPVMGCFDLARHYFERHEQAALRVSPLDIAAQGSLYGIRANEALFEGDLEKAAKLLERSAACFDDVGDWTVTVIQRSHAGTVYRLLGGYERSEELIRSAVDASFVSSLQGWLARIQLAPTLAERGALDAAIVEAESALHEARALAEMSREGIARMTLAAALRLRGDLDAAAREAEAALDLPPMMVLQRATTLATLAAVRLAQGRTSEALAASREAMGQIDSCPVRAMHEPLIRRIHVEALLAAGDHDAARAALAKARDCLLEVAAKIHDPGLRRSFCEDVADNSRTLRLAEEWLRPA